MKKLTILDWVALVLVIIGAIYWGLIGLFNFDLVAVLFGKMSFMSRAIYDLVGLAGLYLIFMLGMSSDRKWFACLQQKIPQRWGIFENFLMWLLALGFYAFSANFSLFSINFFGLNNNYWYNKSNRVNCG